MNWKKTVDGFLSKGNSLNSLVEIQRLVQSFVASRQPEQVIELLEKVIKSNSNFAEAWMLLSSVYRALGQTDKAIKVCKRSLEYNPNNSIIWINLGHLYQENNQYKQAFEPLKKILLLDFALRKFIYVFSD